MEHLPETRSAARRVGSRIGERQWPEKVNRRIEESKNVSPSDVRGRIWGSVGIEENMIAKFDIVGSSGSEPMLKEPPATRRVRQRSIVRMGAKEVTVVEPIRSTSRGSREGLREIDLDKVPARTQSASRTVRDEEETIGGKGDGGVKSSTGNWGKRQRRIIGWDNRDSSGSGDGSNRKRKGQRDGSSRRIGVGIGVVAEFKHRGMISGQGGSEPHVVIHLNIEGGSEGMRERGMRMVKVSEVWGVNRSARKEGWWEGRESLSRRLEQRGSRMAVTTNEIGTKAS
jgi:hypothetical protein